MTKQLALLSFICILISCGDRKVKSDSATLIKGDWIGKEQPEGFEHDQTEFLSFDDSTCRIGIGQSVLQYKIVNDTLYLMDHYDRLGKFTILHLTTDSLIMLSGKKQKDTVKYYKAIAQNNITPSAIYFANPDVTPSVY